MPFDGEPFLIQLELAIDPVFSPVPQYEPDTKLVAEIQSHCESSLLTTFLSFQNYTDYFKCITAKGEDYVPCKGFKRAYNSLCPSKSSLISAFLILMHFQDEWVQLLRILFLAQSSHKFPDRKMGRTTREWNVPGQPRTLEIRIFATCCRKWRCKELFIRTFAAVSPFGPSRLRTGVFDVGRLPSRVLFALHSQPWRARR